jgi:hypothetical protein
VIETIDDSLFFLRQMSQARCILRFLAIPEGLSPSKSSSLEDIVIVVVRREDLSILRLPPDLQVPRDASQ